MVDHDSPCSEDPNQNLLLALQCHKLELIAQENTIKQREEELKCQAQELDGISSNLFFHCSFPRHATLWLPNCSVYVLFTVNCIMSHIIPHVILEHMIFSVYNYVQTTPPNLM